MLVGKQSLTITNKGQIVGREAKLERRSQDKAKDMDLARMYGKKNRLEEEVAFLNHYLVPKRRTIDPGVASSKKNKLSPKASKDN